MKKVLSSIDLKIFSQFLVATVYVQFFPRFWVVLQALNAPIPEKSAYLGESYYKVTLIDFLLECALGIVFLSVVLLIFLILFNRYISVLKWLLVLLFVPSSLFSSVHAYLFAYAPSIWVYFSVFSTDITEVKGFFIHYFSWHVLGFIVSYISALFLLIVFVKKLDTRQLKIPVLLGICSAICLVLLAGLKGVLKAHHAKMAYKNVVSLQPLTAWFVFAEETRKVEEIVGKKNEKKHQKIYQKITQNIQDSGAVTYVVVVGESTPKRRMELYGYERPTSPYLKKEKDLFLFSQVETSNISTLGALKFALTFAETLREELFPVAGSLVHLFNEAGYHTAWISNQLIENQGSTFFVTSQADFQYYTDYYHSNVVCYDKLLLEPFRKELKRSVGKKVIFVHLMGSHNPYNRRYPEMYNFFKEEVADKPWLKGSSLQTFNEFDNAIRYNDYILHKILEPLKEQEGVVAMLYFSDHGEEVYDRGSRHGRIEDSPFVKEVPLIFWGNEAYFARKPGFKEQLTRNLATPFNTENLPHFLQEITDVYCEYYDASKSILHEKDDMSHADSVSYSN